MIDWKFSGTYIAASAGGGVSSVVLGMPISETERTIAIGVIVIFALFFGSIARLATTDGDIKKERRKSLMTFGALYIISLFLANKMEVDLLGAALIAVGVGAAGPLIIIPLADGMTRAVKAFFDRSA